MVRSDPLLGHCVCEQINIYPAVNFLCSDVCERERQRNLVTNLSTGVLTALFVFADKLIGKFSFFYTPIITLVDHVDDDCFGSIKLTEDGNIGKHEIEIKIEWLAVFIFTQPEPTSYMHTKDLNNGISDEPLDVSIDMRTLHAG